MAGVNGSSARERLLEPENLIWKDDILKSVQEDRD